MNKLKKELLGWFMGACIAFAGFMSTACTNQNQSNTPQTPVNHQMPQVLKQSTSDETATYGDSPMEICYKNIQYVFFPKGNASWGAPMYDPGTGHIIVCK